MRTGLLLALIGAWIVARSVVKDDQGKTLIDKILGYNPSKDGGGLGAKDVLSGGATGKAVGAGVKTGESIGSDLQFFTPIGQLDQLTGGDPLAAAEAAVGNLTGTRPHIAPHFAPGTNLVIPKLRRLLSGR